eukprot:TRINITY_DN21583_c0_g1_i1.p1 TRINITY_DN21583_c0_g1~~TRINITY_DN21583_c0_g1_i1.p1  ORF type:complete len:314 (-),score=49.64 TRINITY_DN21583_c0_g1_i1:79-1020(-)
MLLRPALLGIKGLGHPTPKRCFTSTPSGSVSRSSSETTTTNDQSPKEPSTTHFGFKTVETEKKKEMVAEVFHSVANKYDLMNDFMSAGIHRLWKDEFMKTLHPSPGTQLLDVAGGTGDIAFRFMDAIKSNPRYSVAQNKNKSRVTVCDINPSMLEVGKDRARQKGYLALEDPSIEFVVGDAENLPVASESVDAYTIAFGIRNCTNIDKVIAEAHRVLRKGGRFLCLEFSHIDSLGFANPIVQSIYDAYSFNVIPALGQAVTNDRASYQYLVESIRRFPSQIDFCDRIEKGGFKLVNYKNLTLGVAAIHSGFKM